MDEFIKRHSKNPSTFSNVKVAEGDQVFNFGKHKQKSYDWVFKNDVQYVVWVLKSSEEQQKYFKKAYTYFKNRVESEAEEASLTREL